MSDVRLYLFECGTIRLKLHDIKIRLPIPEKNEIQMKQLISDWLLTRKHEPDVQQAKASVAFTEIYPEAKLLSGEGKLLLLTHLYLELRLTLEHAVRAAKADSMATKAQTRRLWVEQHPLTSFAQHYQETDQVSNAGGQGAKFVVP